MGLGIVGDENEDLRLENTYSCVAWSDPPQPQLYGCNNSSKRIFILSNELSAV